METSFLRNLNRSIMNAANDSNQFINQLDKNIYTLSFFRSNNELNIDHESFCRFLDEIKTAVQRTSFDADLQLIADEIGKIPSIKKDDFEIYNSVPAWLTYIILPLGIAYGIGYYNAISSLTDKLRVIESKLQSIAFTLKVNID